MDRKEDKYSKVFILIIGTMDFKSKKLMEKVLI